MLSSEEIAKLKNPNTVPIAIGEATIAWNTVMHAVYVLFETLSGLPSETAKSIYFNVKSDRDQRNMVAELVKTTLKSHNKKVARKLNSILGNLNSIAGRRNDAIHVILLDDQNPLKTRLFHDVGSLKGKAGLELLSAIKDFTIDCLSAAISLHKIHSEIYGTPQFANKRLAKALHEYNPSLGFPSAPNPGGFGLLELPANNEPSPETKD